MNLAKCIFAVKLGKLVGVIVYLCGIEVDPLMIVAIIDMPAPTNIFELQISQGKLQAIHYFIDNFVDKTGPFLKLLKKDVSFHWGKKCKEAFELLKKYLLNTPIVSPPKPDRSFILYIYASNFALGAMLAHLDDEKKERANYYINRTLISYETHYTTLEKLCLAVIFSTQKLCHYMLSQKTYVIAKFDLS